MANRNSIDITQGWTERIRYALTRNFPAVEMDLTGMTIELVGQSRGGVAVSFSGTVGSDDLTGGVAYFDPGPTDLLASLSPYQLRWKVTDAFSKSAFFPRDEPMVWNVENP